MNDPQLIERLANTDLYRDDVALPETMRSDLVLLDIARRMDLDTMERVEVEAVKPPRRRRNGPLIAAAAFALVILVGLAGALITNRGGGTEPVPPATTQAPPTTTEVPVTTTAVPATTLAPEPVDTSAAEPIQVGHDQSRRVTVKFAGDARALAEGGAYAFEIQVHMDGTEGLGGREFTVTYSNTDGTITTTGTDPDGEEVMARWDWFAEDGVQITLLSQNLPDTRPEVTVIVQESASTQPVEFVLDAEAGPIG